MDKLLRKIIIVASIVLLFGMLYLALNFIPSQIEKINLQEEEEKAADIVVMSAALDNIKSIAVTTENGKYTMVNDKKVWGVAEYSKMNFDAATLESAAYGFANVYAKSEVDLPENLSEYGLDAPRMKTQIVLADNTVREFALGNKVTGGAGDFFMDVTNNKLYVISSYVSETMLKDVRTYRQTKIASIKSNDVTRLAITNANGKVVMELEKSAYSSEMVMRMTYPKHADVDETVATPIFEAITDINVLEYVEDSTANLSKYGLANPAVTVEIGVGKANYVLKFGDETNKSVYTVMDGFDSVFLYSPTLKDACKNITTYSLMSKFINDVNIADVAEIKIEGQGKNHVLKISGSDDFYIDGKAALAESFRKTYRTIIGIKGSGLAENNVNSPVEYKIEFIYKKGNKDVIEFASYDDLNYYVVTNKERGFITLKKGLESMMKMLDTLAENPMGKIEGDF